MLFLCEKKPHSCYSILGTNVGLTNSLASKLDHEVCRIICGKLKETKKKALKVEENTR